MASTSGVPAAQAGLPVSQAGEPVLVNIGPQHPSTHGVLRLRALLDGEVIIDLEPVFGYLHSSMEKLAELRTYTQAITLTDRMDYLAAMSNNLAACLAIEKLADIPVPERALYLRLIMVELQRIASHCMFLGTYPNECGAWSTPWMYSFRDREKILDMFEMCCGQRLTYNYIRPGGVAQDVPPEFAIALRVFLKDMPSRVAEYEELLVENEILIARSKHIGILSREQAINASASGPVLRGSGVLWDIRKADPYLIYDRYDFDVPVGEIGDCWDRFWVRMEEIKESLYPSPVLRGVRRAAPGPLPHAGRLGLPPTGRSRDLLPHRVAPRRARLLPRQRRGRQPVPVPRPRALSDQPNGPQGHDSRP